MKKIILLISILLITLIVLHCGMADAELKDIRIANKGMWDIDEVASEKLSADQEDLTRTEKINLGVVAWSDSDKVIQAYKPFLEYLSQFTSRPIRLIILQDETDLRHQFLIGNLQLAIVSVISYTMLYKQMRQEGGLTYLSNFVKVDQYTITREYYNATIFTLDKKKPKKGEIVISDIEYFQEQDNFKKTIMGFIHPESLPGAIYPLYTLLYKKVSPFICFAEISYLGNAANVITAIDQGSINVGAIESEIFDKEETARKEVSDKNKGKLPFNAILTTPCIPFELFLANQNSTVDIKKDIEPLRKAIRKYIDDFNKNDEVVVVYEDKSEHIVMNSKKGFPYSNFLVKERAGTFEYVQLVSKTVIDYVTENKFLKAKK